MNNFIKLYLEINYFFQKIANKNSPENGCINVIGFQATFLSSGILMGLLLLLFGLSQPFLFLVIVICNVIIVRKKLDPVLEKRIDFEVLEKSYYNSSKSRRLSYCLIGFILLVISFFSMIYIPKFMGILFR